MHWEAGWEELLSGGLKIQIFRFRTLVETSSTFKHTVLKAINKKSV